MIRNTPHRNCHEIFFDRHGPALEQHRSAQAGRGLVTISTSDILNAAILIVDDLPANVRLLEKMLHGVGYTRIASTMDPLEVCALHRKNHYDGSLSMKVICAHLGNRGIT
jgi:PleD family two-component response regulator